MSMTKGLGKRSAWKEWRAACAPRAAWEMGLGFLTVLWQIPVPWGGCEELSTTSRLRTKREWLFCGFCIQERARKIQLCASGLGLTCCERLQCSLQARERRHRDLSLVWAGAVLGVCVHLWKCSKLCSSITSLLVGSCLCQPQTFTCHSFTGWENTCQMICL